MKNMQGILSKKVGKKVSKKESKKVGQESFQVK